MTTDVLDLDRKRAVDTARKRRETMQKRQEPPPPSTEAQDGVAAELAMLNASATHPGLAAAAMVLARLLDDKLWPSQHSSASRSLETILTRIREANKGKEGGKLAAMRQARSSA